MANARRDSNESLDARLDALETENQTVHASYWVSGSPSVTVNTPINYDSKEEDTHNAVTTGVGTWRFTCPAGKSGLYAIGGASNAPGTGTTLFVWKGGSAYKVVGYDNASIDSSFFNTIRLNAGEYIDIRPGSLLLFRVMLAWPLLQLIFRLRELGNNYA